MSLTLHTSHGELKVELFPLLAPKACENFLGLAAAGKFDGCKFHRNIAKFIIQSGDTTGSGKGSGGESIWGRTFEDETRATTKVRIRAEIHPSADMRV